MKNDIIKYQNIRNIREDKDISQKEVSEYLNIKQNTYSRYETNERNIPLELLIKLADFYDTSIDYLLGRTNQKKPYPKNKNN